MTRTVSTSLESFSEYNGLSRMISNLKAIQRELIDRGKKM